MARILKSVLLAGPSLSVSRISEAIAYSFQSMFTSLFESIAANEKDEPMHIPSFALSYTLSAVV